MLWNIIILAAIVGAGYWAYKKYLAAPKGGSDNTPPPSTPAE